MKAYIIYDKDFTTDTFTEIYGDVNALLTDKAYEIQEIGLGRDVLAYCMGCFGCWTKKPGECVISDRMKEINHNYMNSDVVIYISPIVFGEFSANMKNAIDRWIPNVLPFFIIRKDKSTMHMARYQSYPRQIIVGYGDDLATEDGQLFADITLKHRREVEVIVYNGSVSEFRGRLNSIELERAGAKL